MTALSWRRILNVLFTMTALGFHMPAVGAVPIGETSTGGALRETPEGSLSLPSDVAVDPTGRIWVVDSGRHRLVVFSPEGVFLMAIGKRGGKDGELESPLGITVDPQGDVFVADAGNLRLQVFGSDGTWRRTIAAIDEKGPFRPSDVAVGEDGALYVTANDRHRVVKFDRHGALLESWGGEGLAEGEFRYPATIAVNEGRIYVVDVLNTRVQIFDEAGRFQYQIGEWGVRPGQLFRPKGIALDARGWVYVSDSYMDLVQVFDDGFEFRHVIGRGEQAHKFVAPTGLAIDAEARLFVCEMLANRVTFLKLH